MRTDRFLDRVVMVGVALAVALAAGGQASAKKLKLTGEYRIRNGPIFLPVQFAGYNLPTGQPWGLSHTSEVGFNFPNGPIPLNGFAEVMSGGAAASITIQAHEAGVFHGSTFIPVPGPTFFGLKSSASFFIPDMDVFLKSGSGNGDLTWCWNSPGCVAANPSMQVNMWSTDPPKGFPSVGNSKAGRVRYIHGANTFGGVFRVFLNAIGDNMRRVAAAPAPPPTLRVVHSPIILHHAQVIGASGMSAGVGFSTMLPGGATLEGGLAQMVTLPSYFITGPLVTFMTQGLTIPLVYGGKQTTGGLLTTQGGMGPILYGNLGVVSTNVGWKATTGVVLIQQTTGQVGADFFSLTGSDNRTAGGRGNITLVSGGMTRQAGAGTPTRYAAWHKAQITFSEPVPSMSPAGFAAAVALMLLAVGYALRRRLQ